MLAVIEREPDGALSARKEQAATLRIFLDRVGGRALLDPADDLGPVRSAVRRAVEMRIQVVQAERVHRGVRSICIKVRCVHDRDFRPRTHGGRRNVLPVLAVIARHLNEPVIGAHPDGVRVHRTRRDRVDHAAAGRSGGGSADVLADVFRRVPRFAREVGALLLPVLPAVHRFPEHVGRVVELLRIDRREEDRHRANAAEQVRRRVSRAAAAGTGVG